MRNNIKISVITVVKDDLEGFRLTTESVLRQDYPDLEWIVIDGLSTDGTGEYIRRIADTISAVKIERDTGIYSAMNKGVDLATGDWIFFMNAGDIFFEHSTVSKYVASMTAKDDVIYSDVVRSEDGQVFVYKPVHRYWVGMVCDHQTTCIRSSIYKKLKFDESFRIAGDFDFLSRARLRRYSFRKLPLVKGAIKPFSVGVSANYAERQIERMRVIKKHFDDRLWRPLLLKEFRQACQNGVIEKPECEKLKKILRK